MNDATLREAFGRRLLKKVCGEYLPPDSLDGRKILRGLATDWRWLVEDKVLEELAEAVGLLRYPKDQFFFNIRDMESLEELPKLEPDMEEVEELLQVMEELEKKEKEKKEMKEKAKMMMRKRRRGKDDDDDDDDE